MCGHKTETSSVLLRCQRAENTFTLATKDLHIKLSQYFISFNKIVKKTEAKEWCLINQH